jgi:hypothetical protein
VDIDDDWTSGLVWHSPLPNHDDDEVDSEAEVALTALEAEARALNDAVQHVERAAGTWCEDPLCLAADLADRALARFHREPYLGCRHIHDLVYLTLWGGAVLAAACPQWECQGSLDHLIVRSRRFKFCGLCDRRSDWLSTSITVAMQPVATGKLMVPAHDACLWPVTPPTWG